MTLSPPRIARLALVLAGSIGLVAACGADAGSSNVMPAESLILDDFSIVADPPVLRAGDGVELVNDGLTQHDVAVEETGDVSALVLAGESGTFIVPDLEPGEYTLYCTIIGHREAGMITRVTVAAS